MFLTKSFFVLITLQDDRIINTVLQIRKYGGYTLNPGNNAYYESYS